MDLKSLARSRGTNLKRVAEECGIPPTTLYAISRGDTNFDNVGISTAIKVARALDMTVEELYTGKRNYAVVELPTDANDRPKIETDDEEELLFLYRKLPKIGKHAVITGLHDYVELQQMGDRD